MATPNPALESPGVETWDNPVNQNSDEEDEPASPPSRRVAEEKRQSELKRKARLLQDEYSEFYCDGKALGFLAPDNGFRVAVFKFVHGR
jgi:hypothetical protein